MDFSLKKSFKSHGSYKNSRKISAGGGNPDNSHEELPILSDHDFDDSHDVQHYRRLSEMGGASSGRNEVIVKIDEGGNPPAAAAAASDQSRNAENFWRENSYGAWKENANVRDGGGSGESFHFTQTTEDPPSKLIGQFLHRQKASGDMSLDMDLEMEELRRNAGGGRDRYLTPVSEQISHCKVDVATSSFGLRCSRLPPLYVDPYFYRSH